MLHPAATSLAQRAHHPSLACPHKLDFSAHVMGLQRPAWPLAARRRGLRHAPSSTWGNDGSDALAASGILPSACCGRACCPFPAYSLHLPEDATSPECAWVCTAGLSMRRWPNLHRRPMKRGRCHGRSLARVSKCLPIF